MSERGKLSHWLIAILIAPPIYAKVQFKKFFYNTSQSIPLRYCRHLYLALISPFLAVFTLTLLLYEALVPDSEDANDIGVVLRACRDKTMMVVVMPLPYTLIAIQFIITFLHIVLPKWFSDRVVNPLNSMTTHISNSWVFLNSGIFQWASHNFSLLFKWLLGVHYLLNVLVPRYIKGSNQPVYKPLDPQADTIRVLRVLPGTYSSSIHCQLLVKRLDDSFDALSYSWGGHRVLRRVITVDGLPFLVTQSVFNALRHLRLEDAPYDIWVDQVCINQGDSAEKDAQVQNKMRFVFSNAKRVVVWLGRAPTLVPKIFEKIRVHAASKEAEGVIDWTEEEKRTLRTVLARRWWSRVWIVQEIALSNRSAAVIRIGKEQVSWTHFSRQILRLEIPQWEPFNANLLQKGDPTQQTFLSQFQTGQVINNVDNRPLGSSDMLLNFLRLAHEYVPKPPPGQPAVYALITLVMTFNNRAATDSKDKIYAFMGLTHEEQPPIDVAYDKDDIEVFAELTYSTILRTNNLSMLGLTEKGPASKGSWIFDWSGNYVPGEEFAIPFWGLDRRATLHGAQWASRYGACGKRTIPAVKRGKDVKSILLSGWQADVVVALASINVRTPWSTFTVFKHYNRWQSFARQHAGDQWYKTFIRVITGGCWDGDPPENMEKLYRDGMDALYNRKIEEPEGDAEEYAVRAANFIILVIRACTNRRMFLTRDGRLGIGPPGLEVGDTVCVFEGCGAPCVLYQRDDQAWTSTSETQDGADQSAKRDIVYGFRGQAFVDEITIRDSDEVERDIESGHVVVEEFHLR